jgi:hypothetical protein
MFDFQLNLKLTCRLNPLTFILKAFIFFVAYFLSFFVLICRYFFFFINDGLSASASTYSGCPPPLPVRRSGGDSRNFSAINIAYQRGETMGKTQIIK